MEWEFGGVDKWDDVSAPGQVGKRVIEGFLGHDVPDQCAGLTENIVHCDNGVAWDRGLRERPVLLPEVSVLTRLVATCRRERTSGCGRRWPPG